tara:strand:+ start:1307 stop:2497 length:1191 start_codon:yes stop_codon:yes gene_type:complete
MKIKSIEAFTIELKPNIKTKPRVPKSKDPYDLMGMVSPMRRYSNIPKSEWSSNWKRTACIIKSEDGKWGFGFTLYSGVTESIINDHLAKVLVGKDCMATELIWDIMQQSTIAYGTSGLSSFAISAIDNAVWDLKGKILDRPVYELIGGPQKDKIFCYASNTDFSYGTKNSIDWFMELGFKAVKLFLREGPESNLEGINRAEELVASTREQVGDDVEIAVDAWMSLNNEYAVRLAETLKPYRIKWLEDYLNPENIDGYQKLRDRIPWQTLATGEHWYSLYPFAQAASKGIVDIFQPDLNWVGGITAGIKICHLAESYGLTVIPHASTNYPYGQHLAYSMPSVSWAERSEGVSPPGVPLEEMVLFPGTPVIKNGYITPSDAPGFGLEITEDWLKDKAV